MASDPSTFYVSCTGSDHGNGVSMATPWATLARASTHTYQAGDRILLERGCVWTGTLVARGSGSAGSPVVVSSYGSGPPPRVVGNNAPALVLRNVSGWTAENLDLSQVGQRPQALDSGNVHGKDLQPDADRHMHPVVDVRALGPKGARSCGASCADRDITLRDLVVHDGQWDGIYVGAGYADPDPVVFGTVERLTVENVESRGNAGAGVDMAGTFDRDAKYDLSKVAVLDSYLHDNGGDGVVMGQVQGGLIQGNRCAYNGRIRNARIGCWAWDSKDVMIQYNESDHNMTPLTDNTASDGGGFDLDMGTVDSTMQYNWSHDNQGEGYLVAGQPVPGYRCCETRNATVRYNVSERDGSKEGGGITLFGQARRTSVYNNTVYYVASRSAGTSMLSGTGGDLTTFTYADSGSPSAEISNNIFISNGTRDPVADDTSLWTDGRGELHLDHNLWNRVEGGVRFRLGGTDLTTWSAWQAQGHDVHGANTDPEVAGPLGGGPAAYQLQQGSPAIGAATEVATGNGTGRHDYFGRPAGAHPDTGAVQSGGPGATRESNAVPRQPMLVNPSVHVAELDVTKGGGGAHGPEGGRTSVGWTVEVVDDRGSPVADVIVTTAVYAPSWDAIDAVVTAVTDGSGRAGFSYVPGGREPAGSRLVTLLQVVPGSSSTYYDSSRNTAWTLSVVP